MQRDVLIIGIACVAAIVVGAILFFFAPAKPALAPAGSATEVPIAVLKEGASAAEMTERKNYRVQDRQQLAAVWAFAYGAEAPPLPSIDFDRHEVLAVFDGQQPTGGYAVMVSKVVDEPDARAVTVTHLAPGEGCVTTQALTNPFQIVRVPRSEKDIERQDQTLEVSCD